MLVRITKESDNKDMVVQIEATYSPKFEKVILVKSLVDERCI